MSKGQNETNAAPQPGDPGFEGPLGNLSPKSGSNRIFRIPDEHCRPVVVTEEEDRLCVEQGNRVLDSLAEITDETDTHENWAEVLRNLGVEPATGRQLIS